MTKQTRWLGLGLVVAAAAWSVWRYWPRREVRNKVVLITGGSRGLGLELAKQFMAGGAKVAICARNESELSRAERTLMLAGGEVSAHVADIARAEAIEELIEAVIRRWGRLDILVNNAAVFTAGPLTLIRPEDYRQIMEVNLHSTIAVTEACRPLLERTRGGIITIVSAAGLVAIPHTVAYAASKAALGMYTRFLEIELADRGIQTMAVYPGYMATGFTLHAAYRGAADQEMRSLQRLTHTPLLSVKPRRGARLILEAWRQGRRALIYPPSVRLGVMMAGVLPELSLRLGRWTSRHYPRDHERL